MAKTVKKPPFAAQGKWAAGLANMPVFIDGLSHSLFYLIVAAKNSANEYQAVVIGKFGSNSFKVKMYGSFEDWGFTQGSLADKFDAHDFLSRKRGEGYERYMTGRAGVEKIMAALAQTRNVTVCPIEGIYQAYDLPFSTRKEISLAVHPQRGGTRPALPFTHVPVLTLNQNSQVATA